MCFNQYKNVQPKPKCVSIKTKMCSQNQNVFQSKPKCAAITKMYTKTKTPFEKDCKPPVNNPTLEEAVLTINEETGI